MPSYSLRRRVLQRAHFFVANGGGSARAAAALTLGRGGARPPSLPPPSASVAAAHLRPQDLQGFSARGVTTQPSSPDIGDLSGLNVDIKIASPHNLRDALVAYKSRTVGELLRAVAVFQTCKLTWLVKNAESLLELGRRVSQRMTNAIVKKTLFAQFCAGEDAEEVKPVMKKLHDHKVGSILDYAAEADLGSVPNPSLHGEANVYVKKTEDHCDTNLGKYLQAIALASHVTDGAGVIAIKATSLGNPHLLQRLSFASAEDLTPVELELKGRLEQRVMQLGHAAKSSGVRMLVDAEQSYFQPAIDGLAMKLMKEYNRGDAIVFNTYQCYLKDSRGKLLEHLGKAREEGWKLGAKLVRGAYMKAERQRAEERGYASPVHDTLEDTHRSFNSSVESMLESVKDGTGKVVIATHNEESIVKAMDVMDKLGIASNNEGVMFGQLQGMCDYLTYSLSAQGYHAYKYLPYGPLHEVMPYLIRRALENSDVLSTTEIESKLMLSEVKRRLRI